MRDSECRACGSPISRGFCSKCGLSVVAPATPASLELELKGHGSLRFDDLVSCEGDRLVGFQSIDGAQRYCVIATADNTNPVSQRYASSELQTLCLGAQEEGRIDEYGYQLYDITDLHSLGDLLIEFRRSHRHRQPLETLSSYILPLFELLDRLHQLGYFLGNACLSSFLYSEEVGWRLAPTVIIRAQADGPATQGWVDIETGFAAPELFGRCGGRLGQFSDVYFGGMVLYAFLTGQKPAPGSAQFALRLPNPQVYEPATPPMCGAVAMRAVSPYITRRYENMCKAAAALRSAVEDESRRRTYGVRSPDVDFGSEIHIGLVKALYSPVNQDQLFEAYDELTGMGLFVVSDGVSISRYGSGDIASQCVRDAAEQLWKRILGPGPVGGPDDTLTFDTSVEVSGQGAGGRTHAERVSFVEGMLNQANIKIGRIVAPTLPDTRDPLESIMAATAVSMFLDRNQATISSIGDSRAYLVRDGHIAQLSVDHNLKTQLMRNGHAPARAVHSQGANALVRCVGDFERAADGALMALPLQPEHLKITLLPGDRIVLCSDGIIDYAGFDEEAAEQLIVDITNEAPSARVAAFELMVAANRGGGGDNISCIVVHVTEPSAVKAFT